SSCGLPKRAPLMYNYVHKDKVEAVLAQAPQRERTTLEEFCQFLKTNASNLEDIDKAWLIFTWLAQNMAYDTEGYQQEKSDTDPSNNFASGKAVCAGYSGISKCFGDAMGLQVIPVNGHAKGLGYFPGEPFKEDNHDWTIMKVGYILLY
ncbi:MAG: hypothetical protein MJ252_28005, partial [archaeon]|nr:hypothetical protein [archaeon]